MSGILAATECKRNETNLVSLADQAFDSTQPSADLAQQFHINVAVAMTATQSTQCVCQSFLKTIARSTTQEIYFRGIANECVCVCVCVCVLQDGVCVRSCVCACVCVE